MGNAMCWVKPDVLVDGVWDELQLVLVVKLNPNEVDGEWGGKYQQVIHVVPDACTRQEWAETRVSGLPGCRPSCL